MKLTIGEKIALLRKNRNITQTELAEYLFLAPQTVSRWEVGNGTPEITLLPRIAAFFGVSIDELFGVTSLERAEDLACKYSVLRDERSFQEAMECVNSQIQTIDAALQNGAEDAVGLEADRDQLEAEKMHLWIQQGREAFQRALKIANAFVEKTEGDPDHPWYLPMRLQRNQLCANLGAGRDTLAERREDFMKDPSTTTLLLYLSILSELERYEEVLSVPETDDAAREIIFPVSEKNLDVWQLLVHAAAEADSAEFIEEHMPLILAASTEQDEYEFLMNLLPFYQKEHQEERLAEVRQRLLALLPGMGLNQYFEEAARKRIESL